MKNRFKANGHKIIGAHFAIEIASASSWNDTNPLINTENMHKANIWAKIIASALNHHNEAQGGI